MPLAGEVIQASDILSRTGCRLRRVANQSVATATSVPISWDTEDEDTGGFIAVTSTTVTIPTGLGGIYLVTFFGSASAGTGRCFAEIVPTSAIAGTPVNIRLPMDVTEKRFVVTACLPLLAADTFVCNVFQSSGGASNFTAWLSCYLLGL